MRVFVTATLLAVISHGAFAANQQQSTITEAQARVLADREMHRRAALENEARPANGFPRITFQQFLTERHANKEVRIEKRSTTTNSCTFRHRYVSAGLGDQMKYQADTSVDLWRIADGDMANQLLGRTYYLVQYGNEEPSTSHTLYFHAGYCVFIDATTGNVLYFVYRS